MRLHLVAVQAALREDAFASGETFAEWAMDLGLRAARRAGAGDEQVVLCFPELVALPLTFALAGPAAWQAGNDDVSRAAWRSLRHDWPSVLAAAVRHLAFGPSAVHLARALAVQRAYVGAFRAVARATGATVVAGSALLPDVDYEAGRGVHVTGKRVYNVSYTFAPSGALLGRSRKAFLTPGLESRAGISRGRVADLPVMHTRWGTLGVAVCLDGWHESVLAHLDAAGAQVVVQPSANDADWARPWPADPRLSEGEAWLTRGMNALLQGRVNVRYGVNPMLVGEAFGFAPRGRSSILANADAVQCDRAADRRGVIALAPRADREAFVHASVELPEAVDAAAPLRASNGRMRP